MMRRGKRVMTIGECRTEQCGAQVAGRADLQRHVAPDDDPLEVVSPGVSGASSSPVTIEVIFTTAMRIHAP
jgi:hypothetical protein